MTREEAIDIIKCLAWHTRPDEEDVEQAIKALEQEPKIGHWIPIDEEPHEDYECDNCGYICSAFPTNIDPNEEYKYCPNCGADMREVEE